jgi:hypothetical protein
MVLTGMLWIQYTLLFFLCSLFDNVAIDYVTLIMGWLVNDELTRILKGMVLSCECTVVPLAWGDYKTMKSGRMVIVLRLDPGISKMLPLHRPRGFLFYCK